MSRLVAGLFLILFAFYALTGPGYSISGDGSFLLLTARNLLHSGSTSVPAIPGTELSRRPGIDGRQYAKYAPGLALAHLPLLAVVGHIERLRPAADGRPVRSLDRDAFYAPFTNAWLTALTVCALVLCGTALGFSVGTCFTLAVVMAFASPLWLYARIDSSEALQTAALVGAAYFLVRERSGLGGVDALAAGACLAVALGAKLVNAVVVPWFLLFAVFRAEHRIARVVAGLAAPLLVTVALLALFNYSRFGSISGTGYELEVEAFDHPILDGVWVQLFSVGHGLLVFWPALALVPVGARHFARRFPAETALVAAIFVSYLALYSKWWAYWGMSWGPRFLVPTLPLVALLLLPTIERGGFGRRLLIALSLAGVAVQSIAVASSYWGQVVPVWQRIELRSDARDLKQWDILVHLSAVSPLRVGLWWLENAGCREPGEPSGELTLPPWSAEFPWRDAEHDPAVLTELRGLDLWAIPECWRRPYTSLWSKEPAPIPSNALLRWLLVGVLVAGATLAASGWRAPSIREERERRVGLH